MRYLPVLLALIFVGCVTAEATRLASSPDDLSYRDASEVALYQDTTGLDCEYDRVATVRVQGGTAGVEDKKMVQKAKKAAGEKGANAIIMGGMNTNDPDYNPLAFGGSDYGSREARFLAVYEDRPCDE